MVPATSIPLNDLGRWDTKTQEKLLETIRRILTSGIFLNGPFTDDLQLQLSRMFDQREFVLVGNGTDALTLALLSCGVEDGDRVATVANAGGYASGATLRLGCIPLLVDIDPDTCQMSASDLRLKLAQTKVRVIVVTHLYGLMADIEAIMTVADEFGCLVIEDCAQSIGANCNGKLAGTFGNVATFSFYPTKNLGAIGDGGALAFSESQRASIARRLSKYGWGSQYSIEIPRGFNSRMDEVQAAVLLERLGKLKKINTRRREIVARFDHALPGERRMIMKHDQSFVGHLAVMVSHDRHLDANYLNEQMIRTSIHYPILDHRQPAWVHIFKDTSLPSSETLVEQILTLPCFPDMSENEIDYVCEKLSELKT